MRDDDLDNAIDDVARAMTGSQEPSVHMRRRVLAAIAPGARRWPHASLGRVPWVGAAAALLLAAVGLWTIDIRIETEPPASQIASRAAPRATTAVGPAVESRDIAPLTQASAAPLAATTSPGGARTTRPDNTAASHRRPVSQAGPAGGRPSPAIDAGTLAPWDGGPAALDDIPPIVVPAPDMPSLDIAGLTVAPLTDITPIVIPALGPDRQDPQRRDP